MWTPRDKVPVCYPRILPVVWVVLEAPGAAVTPEFGTQTRVSVIVIRDTACGAGNRDGLNLTSLN